MGHSYSIFKGYMIQLFVEIMLVSQEPLQQKLPSFCNFKSSHYGHLQGPSSLQVLHRHIRGHKLYLIFFRRNIENVVLGPVTRPQEGCNVLHRSIHVNEKSWKIFNFTNYLLCFKNTVHVSRYTCRYLVERETMHVMRSQTMSGTHCI